MTDHPSAPRLACDRRRLSLSYRRRCRQTDHLRPELRRLIIESAAQARSLASADSAEHVRERLSGQDPFGIELELPGAGRAHAFDCRVVERAELLTELMKNDLGLSLFDSLFDEFCAPAMSTLTRSLRLCQPAEISVCDSG
jgi:hypothetical protein